MPPLNKSAFRSLLLFTLWLVAGGVTRADILTFNTRAGFDAAAPGLPVETFGAASVVAGGVTTCNGPLSAAAAGGCFPAGGLLPGAVFSAGGGAPQPSLAVLGAGFGSVGNTGVALGPNFFSDTLNITFAGANAVGFDLFAGPVAGNVLIAVFDTSDRQLGTFTVFAPAGGTFFALYSAADLIGRVNISSQAAPNGELIANLSFGLASAAAVPEPAAVLLLGTGLAGVVGAARRGRRTARAKALDSPRSQ